MYRYSGNRLAGKYNFISLVHVWHSEVVHANMYIYIYYNTHTMIYAMHSSGKWISAFTAIHFIKSCKELDFMFWTSWICNTEYDKSPVEYASDCLFIFSFLCWILVYGLYSIIGLTSTSRFGEPIRNFIANPKMSVFVLYWWSNDFDHINIVYKTKSNANTNPTTI